MRTSMPCRLIFAYRLDRSGVVHGIAKARQHDAAVSNVEVDVGGGQTRARLALHAADVRRHQTARLGLSDQLRGRNTREAK